MFVGFLFCNYTNCGVVLHYLPAALNFQPTQYYVLAFRSTIRVSSKKNAAVCRTCCCVCYAQLQNQSTSTISLEFGRQLDGCREASS
jgi:hypothetical protein